MGSWCGFGSDLGEKQILRFALDDKSEKDAG
jgi:hypothetical protein